MISEESGSGVVLVGEGNKSEEFTNNLTASEGGIRFGEVVTGADGRRIERTQRMYGTIDLDGGVVRGELPGKRVAMNKARDKEEERNKRRGHEWDDTSKVDSDGVTEAEKKKKAKEEAKEEKKKKK